ncbi:MAG: SLBB domain-containing protein [Chitinophagales bacterium]
MRKLSLAGLILLLLSVPTTIFAQVPITSSVSQSTLESLGFSQSEIDAILQSTGQSSVSASDVAGQIENAQDQSENMQENAAEHANEQINSIAPNTESLPAPVQEVVQDVVQDVTADQPAPGAVFGQDLFRNGTLDLFDKVANAKVGDNYILGEGDQITIAIWGFAYYNQSFTINADGYITTPEVGRIFVKGLTFSAARQLIRQRFASAFDLANSKLDVSLTYSKNIKVNIVGEVVHPGSYNIASINTAFNALVAAGGITDNGSVRNIQIKRNGKIIKTLDVYQFLMNPGETDDAYLEANDYIIVNGIGRVVEVQGEVHRPAKYELTEGENLNELIYYALGLKATAYKRNVTMYRYASNENIVMDLNLDSLEKNNENYPLLDGDKVVFARIPEVIENIVTIQGACRFPGNYQLTEDMRIYDLVTKAKGLNYEAYTDRAYLIRKNDKLNDIYIPFNLQEVLDDPNSPFNFKLNKFDIVDIFSKQEFRETFNVAVQGAVKMPGSFPYYDKMTLKDLLYYAGGLKVEAANNKIEISRIVNFVEASQENQPTRVVVQSISIDKNLEIDDLANSFQLQPYDQVFVRTTPEFEYQKNVTVLGEVRYPGVYTLLSRTETLADVIERAGGITQWAYPEGATMNRQDVTSTLVFLQKALTNPDSKYNYVLREGDVIVVPKQGDLVALKGEIKYPFVGDPGVVVVPFEKGRSARHFVRKYGKNFGDDAKRSETYIVEPNGYVRRTHNFLFLHFYPRVKVKGCQIVVPEKHEEKPEPEQEPTQPRQPFDWNTFATTLSAGILSFATIYVLLQRGN